MAYPGYGSAGAGQASAPLPPGVDPFYQYFSAVAGQDQQISVSELQQCLNTLGWTHFSLTTCNVMMTMLDRDYSGQMGYNEFKELWSALQQWRNTFCKVDTNRSGYIEAAELDMALREFGYNLSPQFIGLVIYKFDFETHTRLNFDQFVTAAIMLRSLTDHFQRRDVTRTGHASFNYDDFMQVTFSCKP